MPYDVKYILDYLASIKVERVVMKSTPIIECVLYLHTSIWHFSEYPDGGYVTGCWLNKSSLLHTFVNLWDL